MYAIGARFVRLVWHLDVDDDDTVYAADVVTTLISDEAARSVMSSGPGDARAMPAGQRLSEALRPVHYGRVPARRPGHLVAHDRR